MSDVVIRNMCKRRDAIEERDFAISCFSTAADINTTTFKFVVPASILNVGAAVVGFYVSESKLISTANNSILYTCAHLHTNTQILTHLVT